MWPKSKDYYTSKMGMKCLRCTRHAQACEGGSPTWDLKKKPLTQNQKEALAKRRISQNPGPEVEVEPKKKKVKEEVVEKEEPTYLDLIADIVDRELITVEDKCHRALQKKDKVIFTLKSTIEEVTGERDDLEKEVEKLKEELKELNQFLQELELEG